MLWDSIITSTVLRSFLILLICIVPFSIVIIPFSSLLSPKGQLFLDRLEVIRNKNSSTFPPPLPPPSAVPSDDDKNLFVYSNIVDEPIDTVWNSSFSQIIGPYNDRECNELSKGTAKVIGQLRKALGYWKSIADYEKIPWMIGWGSTLAYTRDKNLTPWDSDVDIHLPTWSFYRLQKYATQLPIPDDNWCNERPVLLVNREFMSLPLWSRRMYGCDGTVSKSYVGSCTFAVPMARLIVWRRFVDMFATDHDTKRDIVFIQGYRVIVYKNPKLFFPMRRCTFLNIEVRCPNNPVEVVGMFYGPKLVSLLPTSLCIEGKYWEEADKPEPHREWKEQWRKRVGPEIANITFDKSGMDMLEYTEFCKLYPQSNLDVGSCNFVPE